MYSDLPNVCNCCHGQGTKKMKEKASVKHTVLS